MPADVSGRPGEELLGRLRESSIKAVDVARFLDALSGEDRIRAIRGISGKDQRRLYDAVEGFADEFPVVDQQYRGRAFHRPALRPAAGRPEGPSAPGERCSFAGSADGGEAATREPNSAVTSGATGALTCGRDPSAEESGCTAPPFKLLHLVCLAASRTSL